MSAIKRRKKSIIDWMKTHKWKLQKLLLNFYTTVTLFTNQKHMQAGNVECTVK